MNNRKIALAASISTGLAAPIVGGFLLGYFLDKAYETKPWMLLVCGMIGTIGGFLALYRTVNKINAEKEEE